MSAMFSGALRLVVALFVLIGLGGAAYAAKTYWCSKRLDTPIFQEGDLAGKPDRLIAKLGEPGKTLHGRADSLLAAAPLGELFSASDVAGLGERRVEVLVWEQTCLGSTIWQFAAVLDQESGKILAIAGKSSFYSPVYYGG